MNAKQASQSTHVPAKPLVLIPQYFGSIVFDRRTSKYLPFDADASELLTRLQDISFDAVVGEIQDPQYRNQFTRFFEHFYTLGFFTTDLRFAGSVLEVTVPPDHLVGPLAAHLEVVAACNLKCTHCFAGELPRKERPLTLTELDELFASFAHMGTFRLGLTGGEPLLRHDLFEIIDLAAAHGLCPCITTNGLLITEKIAQEFGKRELVWLNVSLEGACAETNDLIRGKGTFDRVLKHLSILSKHAHFTLAFTIMHSNLHEIGACAELAYKVGAHTAVFRPLYPVGVARHHLELMPSFAEYNDALNLLADGEENSHFEFCSLDPFNPQTRQESQSVIYQNFGCGAGNLVCSISVSGDVNPCSFLGHGFVAGNIRERTIEDIWHNSQGFRDIRALPGNNFCGSCGNSTTFAGGCRARALVFNGSINAPDPWLTARAEQIESMPSSLINVNEKKKVYHPLRVLEFSPHSGLEGRCVDHCGCSHIEQ